jgi:hypothetical protein
MNPRDIPIERSQLKEFADEARAQKKGKRTHMKKKLEDLGLPETVTVAGVTYNTVERLLDDADEY